MVFTMFLGYQGQPTHLLWSLAAVFVSISAHCLVFGIFTGAGKDTRELVQDLKLNPEFVGQTKSFRKIAFPPALYSILLLLLTAIFGGALSTSASKVMPWIHGLLAWVSVVYNMKTFVLEYRCIRKNALILSQVNREASRMTTTHPELKAVEDFSSFETVDGLGGYQWGSHVFALGKFLCFLGWNTYLPYIYMRFVMGMIQLPFWPFLMVGVILFAVGYSLRWRYRNFRPGLANHSERVSDRG